MDLNINCPTTVKKTLKANLLTKLSQSIWRKHTLMSVLALLMVFCIPVNRTDAIPITANEINFEKCMNRALKIAEDELNMTLVYSIDYHCRQTSANRGRIVLNSRHIYGFYSRRVLPQLTKRIDNCIDRYFIRWNGNPMSIPFILTYARSKEEVVKQKVADILGSDLLQTCPGPGGQTTVETRLTIWNKFIHNVSGKLTKAGKGNDVKIINLPNGRIAIKSSRNNKYLSSENGTKAMKFNRKSIGAWEEFSPTIRMINGRLSLALRASNGKAVVVKKGALWATKDKESKYIFLFR